MLNFDTTNNKEYETSPQTKNKGAGDGSGGDYGDFESFRVIYIPNDSELQPYEVTIAIDKSINQQLQDILKAKETVKEHISKKDLSYVLFPSVDLSKGKDGLVANERASNLFRKKPLFGDALFVSFHTIFRDISLEEFLKVEKYISNRMTVFDFESSIKSLNEHDLVKLITKRSDFQIDRDVWIYGKKTSSQILNEYYVSHSDFKTQTFKPTVTALRPNGPFVANIIIDGINFYSKITTQKAIASNELGIRVLRYYIARQKTILFGDDPYIDTTEEEYKIEMETYNKEQKEFLANLSKETTAKSNASNLNNDIQINPYEPQPRVDTDFKLDTTDDSSTSEMVELYGIKIKKDHEVIIIKEKEIYKHVIKKGCKPLFPTIGNTISIIYTLRLPSGQIVQEKTKSSIVIGETDCIIGIHFALTYMNPGEHAIVVLDPQYAYGDLGILGLVPPKTQIIVHLEVSNSFENKGKRSTSAMINMSVEDKISTIRKGSEIAKNNFINKKMGGALKDYKNLEDYYNLDYISKTTQEQWEEIQQLASVNSVNIAICYSKMKRWDRTLTYLKHALDFEENCSKTHYWISKCYKNGQSYEEAITELKLAEKIDSQSDKPRMKPDEYLREFQQLKRLLSLQNKEEREMYKRVFEQLPVNDDEENQKEDDLLFDQNNV